MLRFYVWCRWVRLTARRYGVPALVFGHSARHAGVGHASRSGIWASAHSFWSTGGGLSVPDLIESLRLERAYG
jgi:hypothetical protein